MTASASLSRADIESKLNELHESAQQTKDDAQDRIIQVAVVIGIAVVVTAFLLGRRKGKRRSTIIRVARR